MLMLTKGYALQAFAALQANAAECIALRSAWAMFSAVTQRKAFLQWDSWTCDRLQLASQAQSALQHWAQASASKSFAAWAAFSADCAAAKAKASTLSIVAALPC